MAIATPYLIGPTGEFPVRRCSPTRWKIAGQFVANAGAPMVGAVVSVFHAQTFAFIGATLTDSAGAFIFITPNNQPYFAYFVLAGSPEYFGCTGTLIPTPV